MVSSNLLNWHLGASSYGKIVLQYCRLTISSFLWSLPNCFSIIKKSWLQQLTCQLPTCGKGLSLPGRASSTALTTVKPVWRARNRSIVTWMGHILGHRSHPNFAEMLLVFLLHQDNVLRCWSLQWRWVNGSQAQRHGGTLRQVQILGARYLSCDAGTGRCKSFGKRLWYENNNCLHKI